MRPWTRLAPAILCFAAAGFLCNPTGIAADRPPAPAVPLCHDVAVRGATLYAIHTGVLAARDVSDPANPKLVGSATLTGEAVGIVLDGARAFIANGLHGVTVVALTDPWVPTVIGRYNTLGSARSVAVSGNFVAIADDIRGLELVDLTDLEKPRSLASFPTRDRLRSVAWSGTRLATAEGDGGVRLLDVSRPESPRMVATLDAVRPILDVALCEDGVIVAAAGTKGLAVYEPTESARAVLAATVATAGRATTVSCAGRKALVSQSGSRLEIYDVAAPRRPRRIESIAVPRGASAGRAVAAGDLIFFAAGPAGIGIARLRPDLPAEILLPRPRKMTVSIR